MTDDRFTHDPTDRPEVHPSVLVPLENADGAIEAVLEGDTVPGFILTPHNPNMVVEVAGAPQDNEELPYPVDRILGAFGATYAERDGDVLRLFYDGSLPVDLTCYDKSPIVVTVAGTESYPFRLYDHGWTPITGNRLHGAPEACKQMDLPARLRFLSAAEVTRGAFDATVDVPDDWAGWFQ